MSDFTEQEGEPRLSAGGTSIALAAAGSGSTVIGKTHPWRRFLARLFDAITIGGAGFLLYAFLLQQGAVLADPDHIQNVRPSFDYPNISSMLELLFVVPVEAAFLAFAGATPGKWLFGIRVAAAEGGRLRFRRALKRAFLTYVVGEGMGIHLVAICTCAYGFARLIGQGTTLWDDGAGSIVVHREWGVVRAIVCTLAVILAVAAFVIVEDVRALVMC